MTAVNYPTGYRRENWPELYGWAELVAASSRSEPAVIGLKEKLGESFPEPVGVVASGPVYLANEVREFFENNPPRVQTSITSAQIKRMKKLRKEGASVSDIALLLEVSVATVYRYLNG